MAISAVFSASFDKLEAAVNKATITVKTFETGAKNAAKSMNTMAESFSGAKIQAEALKAAKAVESIGGVTKLTAAEQVKLIDTVERANDKYAALGQTAPAAIQKISKELENTAVAQKKASDAAEAAQQKQLQNIQTIGSGLSQAGTVMAAAISVPIAAGFALSIKAAKDFESAFAGVVKTVDGLDVDKFGKLNTSAQELRGQIIGLSKEIPVSAVALSNIAAVGGQFGVSRGALLEFTKTVAELGVAIDGISAEDAAAALAQIAKVAHVSEQDFGRMASTLVDLGNKGSSTEGTILEFSKRLAGAGAQAGLTAPEIFGIGAAMANVGLEAEAGGSAMSKLLAELTKAAAVGGKDLQLFAQYAGMSSEAFQKLFKENAAGALQSFIQGLHNAKEGGENLQVALDKLGITEIRERDTILRLAGAYTEIGSQVGIAKKAFQDNTALAEEARKRFVTFDSQLQLFKNQVVAVGIELGGPMLNALRNALTAVTPLIHGIETLAQGFSAMPESLQTAALLLGGAVGLAPIMILLAGNTIKAYTEIRTFTTAIKELQVVTTVTGWLGGFSGAVGKVLAVIGGLPVAVAAAGTALAAWIASLNLGTNIVVSMQGPLGQLIAALTNSTAAANTQAIASKASAEQIEKLGSAHLMASHGVEAATAAHKALAPVIDASAALSKQFATDLAGKGRQAFIDAASDVKMYGSSMKEAAAAHGIAETSLHRWIEEQQAATKAVKAHNTELEKTETFQHRVDMSVKASRDIMSGFWKKLLEDATAGAKRFDDQIKSMWDTAYKANQDADATIRSLTMSSLDFQIDALGRETQARKEAIASQSALAQIARDAIDRDAAAGLLKLIRTSDDTKAAFAALGAEMSLVFRTDLSQIFGGVDVIPKVTQQTTTWTQGVQNLSSAFSQLSQVTGGAFGAVTQGIGTIVSAMNVAIEGSQKFFSTLGDPEKFKAVKATMADLANAIVGGVSSISSATSGPNLGQNIAGGALSGATSGAAIAGTAAMIAGATAKGAAVAGVWGAAAGVAVGIFIAVLRGRSTRQEMQKVGHEWGVDISQGLADEVRKGATQFRGQDVASAVFNLKDIIKEAGGLNDLNFNQFLGHMRDVFVMIERGLFTTKQAGQVLNDNFDAFAQHVVDSGRIASQGFQDILALNASSGVYAKSVLDFVDQRTQAVGTSLAALAAPLLDSIAKWQAANQAATDAGKAIGDQSAFIASSAAELNDLGTIAVGAFGAARKAGLSFVDAVKAIGPGLDALIAAQQALGTTSDNVALQELIHFRDRVNQNQTLVSGAEALNQTMLGLSQIGGLNADTLAAMESQGQRTFDRLIDSGFTENEALSTMSDFLLSVIDAHEQLGIPIDENTAKLIDMADQYGLLKKDGKSMTDILEQGFHTLSEAINRLIETMGGMPLVIDDVADSLSRLPSALPNPFEGWQVPNVDVPAGDTPQTMPSFANGTDGAAYFGSGTLAMLHGWERVIPEGDFQAMMRDVSAGGHGGTSVVNHNDFRGALVGDYASQQQLRRLLDDAFMNDRDLRTQSSLPGGR